jgi:hypothetical protein
LSEEARYSVTVKSRAGSLVTVRGDSAQEFLANITGLEGFHVSAIAELERLASEQATGDLNTVLTHLPGSQVVQDQQLPASVAPVCKDCGAPTRYEEWTGKNGKNAGRQFKAWKCVRDKDHRPEWVN